MKEASMVYITFTRTLSNWLFISQNNYHTCLLYWLYDKIRIFEHREYYWITVFYQKLFVPRPQQIVLQHSHGKVGFKYSFTKCGKIYTTIIVHFLLNSKPSWIYMLQFIIDKTGVMHGMFISSQWWK